MADSYYNTESHGYMRYANDRLAEYLYSLLPLQDLSSFDTAVELGAGMGRFSAPLLSRFKQVTLVEPEPTYAQTLRDKFTQPSVSVVESSARDYFRNPGLPRCALFAFHLMHHLDRAARAEIFHAAHASKSCGILVEPNPFNPLILTQVLCHPDMRLREEQRYLTLTQNVYKRELEEAGLCLRHYQKVLFLPPFLTDFLLQRVDRKSLLWAEKLNQVLPFLSSYQVMVFGDRQ